jgi:tetratricopeptide (TPR) repeat protein
MAREEEAAGRPERALESWRVAAALRPGDEVAVREISRLQDLLAAAADEHFHRGIAFDRKGSPAEARKEFLLALVARPDHAQALDYLKNRLHEDTFSYQVAEGDSYEGIARKFYEDPELAFLVARTNDLDMGTPPLPGRELILPILEDEPTPPPAEKMAPEPKKPPPTPEPPQKTAVSDGEFRLAKAEGYLEAGSYREALDAAAGIPPGDPAAEAARALINTSLYELGGELERKKQYLDALGSYRKVNPGFRDVKKKIASLEKRIGELAEEHYIAGMQFFINQKLPQAISEWEKTLALSPDHPKASEDIIKAQKLIEELQKIR